MLTNNKNVLNWVDEMVALCQPDKVVWIDGSEEQLNALREEAISTGEMIKLNEEKLPGCLYHRTNPNDVARVEDRTFICTKKEEDAGPTNNWMDPDKMHALLNPLYTGVMKGRTMYVIPYSMGPIGSPLAKVGVEVTDSIYVVLNMDIMTRMGKQAFENLGETSNDFVRGLHSKADVDPEKRYIVQFPEENTICSINSAYGGNVLLGKKCFALRIASYQGKNEGWMAEHMLILGIENPEGETKYICAAFPSACGKTNLAMLIPPEIYQKKGYKVWTVGDDIAWLKPGPDGRLYAINPENGFFGVAPGTNLKSNPNALHSTEKGTIFTNVAINEDTNTVWWESLDKNPPRNMSPRAASWPIRTPASPRRQRTAPACRLSSITPTACRSPRSSSAAAARRPLRWSTSPSTGSTAPSSARSWLLRPPLPLPAQSALSAATRWRCCPSAATTWATTGSTGSTWARSWATRPPRSSTSTGSEPTRKATSSGRALATTCAS